MRILSPLSRTLSTLVCYLTLLELFSRKNSIAAAILVHRQSGNGDGDSDSDSDSDSDGNSQSCSNGVCVVTTCNNHQCTTLTSTRGSKPTSIASQTPISSNTNSGSHSGNSGHASTTSSSSLTSGHPPTSTAKDGSPVSSVDSHKKGLSNGGIAGLVIGLAILVGLIAMLLAKRRASLRHRRQRPRGMTLLSPHTSSNSLSVPSSDPPLTTDMVESPFTPNERVAPFAAGAAAFASRNVGSLPHRPYNGLVGGADVPRTLSTAHPNASPTQLQAPWLIEVNRDLDLPQLSSDLPSPHEQDSTELATVPLFVHDHRLSSQEATATSTTFTELATFQKGLQRDHEKNIASDTGSPNRKDDPPPVYTD